MALSEASIISAITIANDGQIQVQRADIILRDGVEIARNIHQHVLAPGDDVSAEDAKVQEYAVAAWTPEVIAAAKAAAEARAKETP